MGIAGDIALIVVAALVGGLLAHLARLPIVLGYIVAGVLVGPHTGGPTVVQVDDVEVLADLGIALLLFTVGLEFPIERLAPVRGIALVGTPLTMALTVAFGFVLGLLLDWEWQSALWFGCLISVSSTMVVLKVLADRGLMGTLSSQIMTAVLIVQDLAVIPMMVLLPALKNLSSGLGQVGIAVLTAGTVVAAMLYVGGRALPWMMARVASWRSRELFMITVLALGLGIGYTTWNLGLSFAFGAFLAGVVLARSEFSHQALSEVIPLRDLFAMIFFVSVGMLLEPAFLEENGGVLLFLLAVVITAKALILGLVTRAFGYVNIVPAAAGLYLCQIGEFSFVLARLGDEAGALDHEAYLTILTLAALSMVATPFLARLAQPLYSWWRRRFGGTAQNTIELPSLELRDHVVVVGYGRVGRFVASVLASSGRSVLVLDNHPDRVKAAREAGHHAIPGDASAEVILEAGSLGTAELVILTLPDPLTSVLTLQRIRHVRPDVKVLARASGPEHLRELEREGVLAAVIPELEGGLEVLREALLRLGRPEAEVQALLQSVRREQYAPMLTENGGTDE